MYIFFMKKVQKLSGTTEIILETRFPRKDGLFPVKLRVTFNRKQKYYTLRYSVNTPELELTEAQKYWLERLEKGISLTKAEFDRVRKNNAREPYKTMKVYLDELELLARGVISSLTAFSFSDFKKTYFDRPLAKQDLFHHLTASAKELRNEGKISTAVTFECTLSSLKAFTNKETLSFDDVTVPFLNKYESWMRRKNNSPTTVGIYLRNVRKLYRKAEKSGIVKPGKYPFGEDKYQIPTGRNIKKALTHKQVGQIANYESIPGSSEQRYRDYWLFSYLCNGINVKDISRLTYGNIDGDIIILTRAKTERERKHDPRPITIVITKLIGRIIDRWGNEPRDPDQYIFPILSKGMTPEMEYDQIHLTTQLINKYIDQIATELKIPQKVTSYTARHSFATVLKRSGASIEFISESLGHSSMATTENYLADFEIEEKRKWANKAAEF
jgi:integrase/recombinase XerD